MARVRLRVWEQSPTLPIPPAGAPALPFLRVVATVLLGPDAQVGVAAFRYEATAAIDTGSPFNIIAGGVWQLYERLGLLERLGTPAGAAPLTVAGHQHGYEIGRMWVAFADADYRSRPQLTALPAVPVIFQLLTAAYDVIEHPIILGLSGGHFDGRSFSRVAVAPQQAIRSRHDSGRRHGQEWYLHD